MGNLPSWIFYTKKNKFLLTNHTHICVWESKRLFNQVNHNYCQFFNTILFNMYWKFGFTHPKVPRVSFWLTFYDGHTLVFHIIYLLLSLICMSKCCRDPKLGIEKKGTGSFARMFRAWLGLISIPSDNFLIYIYIYLTNTCGSQ